LREALIDPANTASDVWADTAYRSATNERFLDKAGKVSRIHHKKPRETASKTRRATTIRQSITTEPGHERRRHQPQPATSRAQKADIRKCPT
jgi:hypothetical protein